MWKGLVVQVHESGAQGLAAGGGFSSAFSSFEEPATAVLDCSSFGRMAKRYTQENFLRVAFAAKTGLRVLRSVVARVRERRGPRARSVARRASASRSAGGGSPGRSTDDPPGEPAPPLGGRSRAFSFAGVTR